MSQKSNENPPQFKTIDQIEPECIKNENSNLEDMCDDLKVECDKLKEKIDEVKAVSRGPLSDKGKRRRSRALQEDGDFDRTGEDFFAVKSILRDAVEGDAPTYFIDAAIGGLHVRSSTKLSVKSEDLTSGLEAFEQIDFRQIQLGQDDDPLSHEQKKMILLLKLLTDNAQRPFFENAPHSREADNVNLRGVVLRGKDTIASNVVLSATECETLPLFKNVLSDTLVRSLRIDKDNVEARFKSLFLQESGKNELVRKSDFYTYASWFASNVLNIHAPSELQFKCVLSEAAKSDLGELTNKKKCTETGKKAKKEMTLSGKNEKDNAAIVLESPLADTSEEYEFQQGRDDAQELSKRRANTPAEPHGKEDESNPAPKRAKTTKAVKQESLKQTAKYTNSQPSFKRAKSTPAHPSSRKNERQLPPARTNERHQRFYKDMGSLFTDKEESDEEPFNPGRHGHFRERKRR